DATPRAPEVHPGVAYFGGRPTFGQDEVFLEAHLFDFSGDLYGRQLRVSFIEHLRGDQAFESAEALQRQMEEGAAPAGQILAQERALLGAYEAGLDAIEGPRRGASSTS